MKGFQASCELSAMSLDALFIVIPAFNEGDRLDPVLRELAAEYSNLVVVDDGSADGTSSVARRHTRHVLRHAINRGQGAALQTGITYSLAQGADLIVTFDGDGQHQVDDIPAILQPITSGEVDVTLGSRFLENRSNVPLLRSMVLKMARVFTWITSGLYLSDCHNGFRAMSRRAAEQIHLRQDRMAHASEIYDQIRSARLSYTEVPVSIRYTAETLAKGQTLANSMDILIHYLFGKVSR